MVKGRGGGQGARGRHAVRTNSSSGCVEMAASVSERPAALVEPRSARAVHPTPCIVRTVARMHQFCIIPQSRSGSLLYTSLFYLIFERHFSPLCSPKRVRSRNDRHDGLVTTSNPIPARRSQRRASAYGLINRYVGDVPLHVPEYRQIVDALTKGLLC